MYLTYQGIKFSVGLRWKLADRISQPLSAKHSCSLYKNGPFPGLFFLYFSIFKTVYYKLIVNRIFQRLDSNCGPLILEATALPTEPQPLPKNTEVGSTCYQAGLLESLSWVLDSLTNVTAPCKPLWNSLLSPTSEQITWLNVFSLDCSRNL